MKKISFIVLGLLGLLNACTTSPDATQVKGLSTPGIEATAPYFTTDHNGNAVLCWTEKDGGDSLYRLKYAVFDAEKNSFNTAVTVPASAGCSNSAESMGKIAFKTDGTVFAVFSKRFPNEKNPYAGAIYYSLSDDAGKSWSPSRFLHSDTSHSYGRSFFDVATLKDGELAAIWLDGRYGKSIKGSALFFARTEKGKGFGADNCLDKGTCECCRTAIFTDDAGKIHLAYRSIMFPSALAAKQVRDMVYKVSADNGKTFTPARTISNDNWEIEGCPHSGPSLAADRKGLQVVWFTAGGGAGLYYSSAKNPESGFGRRTLLTTSGRHPQLVALSQDKAAMVCEEPISAEPDHKMNHSHGSMNMSHPPAGAAKITLSILKNGSLEKTVAVTEGKEADHHAVLIPVKEKILIAWVREQKPAAKLCYTLMNLNE